MWSNICHKLHYSPMKQTEIQALDNLWSQLASKEACFYIVHTVPVGCLYSVEVGFTVNAQI